MNITGGKFQLQHSRGGAELGNVHRHLKSVHPYVHTQTHTLYVQTHDDAENPHVSHLMEETLDTLRIVRINFQGGQQPIHST